MRGPAGQLTFDGAPVTKAAVAAVADGANTPVSFGILSHAGTISVTVIVDPDHFPELDDLAAAMAQSLSACRYRYC